MPSRMYSRWVPWSPCLIRVLPVAEGAFRQPRSQHFQQVVLHSAQSVLNMLLVVQKSGRLGTARGKGECCQRVWTSRKGLHFEYPNLDALAIGCK